MLYLCPEDFYMKENFARGDLPSRQSLRALLKNIFSPDVVKLPIGESFIRTHKRQSDEFDIRMSPLSVIYAALELRFNLIRAMTPEYSTYKYEANPTYLKTLQGDSRPEAKAILRYAKTARKYTTLEPTPAAQASKLPRNRIIRLLNELGDQGIVRLQPSGVEQKYRVLDALPRTDAAIDDLADKLHADLQHREKQALDRIHQMINMITGPKCFALSLAEHFGMSLPNGARNCGHCTYCVSGKALEPPPRPPKVTDHAGIERVLKATDVRDDPRFLARVAFGIKSPRVGKLGLDKDPAFMSMAGHDFDVSSCTPSVTVSVLTLPVAIEGIHRGMWRGQVIGAAKPRAGGPCKYVHSRHVSLHLVRRLVCNVIDISNMLALQKIKLVGVHGGTLFTWFSGPHDLSPKSCPWRLGPTSLVEILCFLP